MKSYEKESDMPIGEHPIKGKNIVHHLICNGSRKHTLYYDSNGCHCIEPRCEINYKKKEKM